MATIELNVDPSKSVEPIRELADALDQVNAAFEETGKTSKETFSKSTKAVDGTTDAIMDQTKAQQKNEAATDDLKKSTAEMGKTTKKAYDDKPVDEYKKSVDQADQSVNELDDSTEDMGKSSSSVFGGLKEGLGDIGGDIGEIGGALGSGDAGGIQGGLGGILGKIGPVGVAIGAVVGGVVALGSAIIDIDKEFDELRGTVEQLFDETEDQIDRIVVNTKAIAVTFDEDVNDVLLATNALAKEFGISGEAAGNLLASGFNSAANAQGDLVDGVKEFSAQIRASGGDADTLFRILEKSNQEGIVSDKGIDVVKEFGLRIREQGDATKDALEAAFGEDFSKELFSGISDGSITSIDALALVSEELGGLEENSKEAQTVIADVFGGAGEDAGFRFLTLLKDINDEQGFSNRQLTEEQQRKKETLEANQRLAAAQNKLSKAIGDSSQIGRIWIDIQTFFVELLVDIVGFVEDVIDAFSSWDNFTEALGDTLLFILDPFHLLTDGLKVQKLNWDELTDAEKRNIGIKREATQAIRKFGKETALLTSKLEKQFKALAKGTLTDQSRLKVVNELNKAYPEQIGNVDLLSASEEELLKIKQDIIKAEVEADIARKKRFALAQLETQLDIRRAELERGVSDARQKQLEDEIKFLDNQFRERIDLVEEEIRIQVGLEKRADEEIVESEEEKNERLKQESEEAGKQRIKDLQDFNKAIEEILKRGEKAFIAEQTVSQEERLKRQRDFQIKQIRQLLTHAQDLNEKIKGTRQLEQKVIDSFNLAEEKIEIEFQDKIEKVKSDARKKALTEELAFNKEFLAGKEDRFQQELALLTAREAEELAIIEQQIINSGEKERDFERRKQLEALDAQQFFLNERIKLIDREENLKLESIQRELDAIEGKEGDEFELKRINLENKKKLLEQETDTQEEQLNLQLKNINDQISDLENIKGPTLGQLFDDIQSEIAAAFGLSPEQLSAITGALQQVAGEIFKTVQDSVKSQLEANAEIIAQLEEREEKVKESLEREIAFAEQGYAANVEAKRSELDQIQDAEENAAEQRANLLKQQEALDNISQTTSLITASANLYKSLSVLPFGIGIAIATLLTAGMFASFAATKSKAKNITKLEKGGSGTNTGMINGNRHSSGGESFLDNVEVEDGERWSVFNRKGSGKYADMIEDFTNAVNTDNMTSFLPNEDIPDILIEKNGNLKGSEIALQSVLMSEDIKKDLSVIPEIKEALISKFSEPKEYIYTDESGDTWLLQTKSNGSRKKIKLKQK